MPKFGVSFYTNCTTAVIFVNGKKCRVTISDIELEDYSSMPIDAKVKIEPVGDLEQIDVNPDPTRPRPIFGGRRKPYLKFGGWPDFIQNECEPVAEDGTPYTYICTINNDWGDSGNGNVFALIRDNFFVEDVYIEASCC